MAIVQNPIIGVAKKTAGGMVFSRSLDQNVIRAKPITYNDRKSPAQVAQRTRMTAVARLVRGMQQFILDALYPTRPKKQTKFSRLMQELFRGFSADSSDVIISLDNLDEIGNGTANLLFKNTAASNQDGKILVEFQVDPSATAIEKQSKLYLVGFEESKGKSFGVISELAMQSGAVTFDMPSNIESGDTVSLFMGRLDAETFNSSKAIWVGALGIH